ncbi:MAG TPA: flavin reductase family protein [Candidatus Acidoferrum sp.]|nr:flavin reductase family protein [Candidatus Acidoferrum sp.]
MKKVKLNNQAVGPFPTMLVGASADGKENYATVGAGGCACLAPVLCVSLKDTHLTTKGILQTGYFSVNIPSIELLDKTDYCGLVSGKDVDKSMLFTSFFNEESDTPMIEECPLNFLCKVCDKKEIQGFTMFFGEIVAVYVNEDCLSDGQPDPMKIDPIIMMGFSYCRLKEIIGRPFTEGKKYIK